MAEKIEILIAEDHPIFRRGLLQIINKEPDMVVVADLSNGLDVVKVASTCNPKIILLDIDMPLKSGLQVAADLKEEGSKANVIFLTSNSSYKDFSKAIEVGAKGYVLKDNAIEETVNCIRMVSSGKSYITPALSEYLLQIHQSPQEEKTDSLKDKLSPSEFKILQLISSHKTTKVISEELFISPKTVENHRTNISKKLGLSGANSLLKFALLHPELNKED